MSLNLDFVAIISQFSINVVFVLSLAVYLVSTYSWESNSKQEVEAENQFHQMRANLAKKQMNPDGSVHESLLPRDQEQESIQHNQTASLNLFDLSQIAPNMTTLQGMNANARQQQRNFMQDTINSSKQPENEDDDNFREANSQDDDEDNDLDDFFSIRKPASWCECLSMIYGLSEERLLMIQNPDGLLYLTFLKQSGFVFLLLSILSVVTLVLLYAYADASSMDIVHPEDTWNFSRLDKLTLAAFLDEQSTIWVSILLMYVNSAIAYQFLHVFSSKMSEFEFYSSNTFIDCYVANHSVIITGVNQDLSTEYASKKVKKVFDYRFRGEDTKVVSCNTFRQTTNVQKHWRKVKNYRAKQAEFEQESFASGEQKLIWVGSRLKCNRRQVEGSKFYGEKLEKALEDWKKTKTNYETKNQGVVVLVFKTKACAEQVYEELVKMLGSQRLSQQKNEYFKELRFNEWRVYPGIPSEDIIWPNISQLMQVSAWKRFISFMQPVLISSIAIFSILLLEAVSLHYAPVLSTFNLYLTTTLLVLFSFYATPYLVFNSVQQEAHAQKSLRDKAYMRRLVIIEILNVFVIPILFNILLVLYSPEGYRGKTTDYQDVEGSFAKFVDIIAYSEEMLLRFLLQAIMVIIVFQWRSDPRTILKTFLSSFMLTGRNKFKHYLYDLGLRNVLAVTMFTLGLCCSVLVPLAMPICTILFFLTYAFDKYNLFFVYPIDFESQLMNRKILIKCTFCAILLFQAITISVVSSMIDQTSSVYLFTVLVIQLLVCLIIFEFVRSPWKGARLKIEEAEEELQNRLFEDEDIGQYDFADSRMPGDSQMPGDTTLIGLKKQEVITADEKLSALKTNYEDPFVEFIKALQNDPQEESKPQEAGNYESPAGQVDSKLNAPFLGSASVNPEQKSWQTTPLQSIPERGPFQQIDPAISGDP